MRLAIFFAIGATAAVAVEPIPYHSLSTSFWRGNFGNVLDCFSHQISKDIIRMREAGITSPENEIFVNDKPIDLPVGSIEVTFTDTDSNYSCVPMEESEVSLISIEIGEIITICKKWYPGCDN